MVDKNTMEKKVRICGIIMPISNCDGLDHSHWSDVLSIIRAAAIDAGFEARLVSDTFESNLIHKEILSNVYNDEIIVCDVSGRNPNVFFELGIRMATQKPTVIIKDDRTVYPFDTSPNRYIEYPRDLRHPGMEKFKKELASAIGKTIAQEPEASFIGQLGPFQIPKIDSKEAPISDVILQRLSSIERKLSEQTLYYLENPSQTYRFVSPVNAERTITITRTSASSLSIRTSGYPEEMIENALTDIRKSDDPSTGGGATIRIRPLRNGNYIAEMVSSHPLSKLTVDRIFSEIDDAMPF